MSKRIYDIELFYHLLIEYIDDLEEETDFPNHYYQSLLAGSQSLDNQYEQIIKKYDGAWIKIVESYFYSIDKIIRNLKSILRYDEEEVIVEKAKKTDSQTIRHLAANTHLIRQVNGDDIIPEKVLIKQPEIEYGIYENRFIKTLINKLAFFVDRKVKELEEAVLAKEINQVNYNTNFDFASSNFDVEIKVKQSSYIAEEEILKHNKVLLSRAKVLQDLVGKMHNSSFMKLMANYKDVRPPIMKTQIILKNADYRNCYMLWLFLEQDTLHTDFEELSKKDLIPLSPMYKKSLNQAIMYIIASFYNASKDRKELKEDIKDRKFTYTRPKVSDSRTDLNLYNDKDENISEIKLQELFLNKMEMLLLQKTNQLVSEEDNSRLGIKQALTDLTNIVNSIYEKYFELPTERNMFSRLIKDGKSEENIKAALDKIKMLTLVNEVKYTDYRKNILQINDYYRELTTLEKELFKVRRASERDSINEEFRDEYNKTKTQIDKQIKKIRARQQSLIKEERSNLREYRKNIRDELTKQKRDLRDYKKKLTDKNTKQNETRTKKYIANKQKQLTNQLTKQLSKLDEQRKKLINDFKNHIKNIK